MPIHHQKDKPTHEAESDNAANNQRRHGVAEVPLVPSRPFSHDVGRQVRMHGAIRLKYFRAGERSLGGSSDGIWQFLLLFLTL
jgi:hypothetical protein